MAPAKVIDPQYLYIVPKYFTLKPTAKRSLEDIGPFCLTSTTSHLYFLNILAGSAPKKIFAEVSQDDIAVLSKVIDVNAVDDEEYNWTYLQLKIYESLQQVGLDFHGGIGYFMKHRKQHKEALRFSCVGILVMDEEKASEYVELGIKLESTTVDNPATLKEAATLFSKIARLVDGGSTVTYTTEDLEKWYHKSSDENLRWFLKRLHFRLKLRAVSENFVLDIAHKAKEEKERDNALAQLRAERKDEVARTKRERLFGRNLNSMMRILKKEENIKDCTARFRVTKKGTMLSAERIKYFRDLQLKGDNSLNKKEKIEIKGIIDGSRLGKKQEAKRTEKGRLYAQEMAKRVR